MTCARCTTPRKCDVWGCVPGTFPPEQTLKANAMWGEYDLYGRWQHDPLLPMTADDQRADNLARGWPCP